MGQYWKPVNIDKREFIDPHKLGAGLKLWEQLAAHPGTGAALIILCAAMPHPRGGGDFDVDQNWHGPERVDFPDAGPMPEEYPAIAKQTIGRWAGDRIALIGDYAEPDDIEGCNAQEIYGLTYDDPEENNGKEPFKDITDLVVSVIEHELGGKYKGDGWRHFDNGNIKLQLSHKKARGLAQKLGVKVDLEDPYQPYRAFSEAIPEA